MFSSPVDLAGASISPCFASHRSGIGLESAHHHLDACDLAGVNYLFAECVMSSVVTSWNEEQANDNESSDGRLL
ncbi:MAG: hypothetical protein QOJ51_6058 [Acidobacteriaceae bacterium]|jgi:hypothetical protein|nr:hypothetical protein [Acidobacteriaceae bacterium]MEA2263233.1 hypothetical protein [Acidobacteriaceae bacterium]